MTEVMNESPAPTSMIVNVIAIAVFIFDIVSMYVWRCHSHVLVGPIVTVPFGALAPGAAAERVVMVSDPVPHSIDNQAL